MHLQEFEELGVAYQKIQVEGHVVPKNLYSKMSVNSSFGLGILTFTEYFFLLSIFRCRFRDTVNAFLEENADNGTKHRSYLK